MRLFENMCKAFASVFLFDFLSLPMKFNRHRIFRFPVFIRFVCVRVCAWMGASSVLGLILFIQSLNRAHRASNEQKSSALWIVSVHHSIVKRIQFQAGCLMFRFELLLSFLWWTVWGRMSLAALLGHYNHFIIRASCVTAVRASAAHRLCELLSKYVVISLV